MSQILADLEGTICLIDDILIYGKTQEEHDARLTSVRKTPNSRPDIKQQQMRVL